MKNMYAKRFFQCLLIALNVLHRMRKLIDLLIGRIERKTFAFAKRFPVVE